MMSIKGERASAKGKRARPLTLQEALARVAYLEHENSEQKRRYFYSYFHTPHIHLLFNHTPITVTVTTRPRGGMCSLCGCVAVRLGGCVYCFSCVS
jgi:hypothetical protein